MTCPALIWVLMMTRPFGAWLISAVTLSLKTGFWHYNDVSSSDHDLIHFCCLTFCHPGHCGTYLWNLASCYPGLPLSSLSSLFYLVHSYYLILRLWSVLPLFLKLSFLSSYFPLSPFIVPPKIQSSQIVLYTPIVWCFNIDFSHPTVQRPTECISVSASPSLKKRICSPINWTLLCCV